MTRLKSEPLRLTISPYRSSTVPGVRIHPSPPTSLARQRFPTLIRELCRNCADKFLSIGTRDGREAVVSAAILLLSLCGEPPRSPLPHLHSLAHYGFPANGWLHNLVFAFQPRALRSDEDLIEQPRCLSRSATLLGSRAKFGPSGLHRSRERRFGPTYAR